MNKTKSFVHRAQHVHGDRYDYSQVIYNGARAKVIIVCKTHGSFSQTPDKHINSQTNCPTCSNVRTTSEQFIEKAKKVHGDRYDYSFVEYKRVNLKVDIICDVHGRFAQQPNGHLAGNGCPYCATVNKRNDSEAIIERAKKVHNDKFDYSLLQYSNIYSKVNIICPKHGQFATSMYVHLRGSDCPKCAGVKYSKKAIVWLTHIANEQQILIEHAENGGEHRIPNTKYVTDGYCNETKTIYEFYGDRFHGNLSLFNRSEKCHPYDKHITAGELYDSTMDRERTLESLGYTIVSIWEHDFNLTKGKYT